MEDDLVVRDEVRTALVVDVALLLSPVEVDGVWLRSTVAAAWLLDVAKIEGLDDGVYFTVTTEVRKAVVRIVVTPSVVGAPSTSGVKGAVISL